MKRYLLIACGLIATTAHCMQAAPKQYAPLVSLLEINGVADNLVEYFTAHPAATMHLATASKRIKERMAILLGRIILNKKFAKRFLACTGKQFNENQPAQFENFTELTNCGYKGNLNYTTTFQLLHVMDVYCVTSLNDKTATSTLLAQLKTLNLAKNNLEKLPASIGKLTRLMFLKLGKNQLTSLPNSIGNLTNLKQLFLSYNKLSVLPESIGNLTNLKYLGLRNNQLTTLPENINNLISLAFINLQNNKLDEKARTLVQQLKARGVNVVE
jgi:hypothetical protein